MFDVTLISAALGPCVALTSGIFFASGLQNRFATVTGRVRDLNREVRGVLASAGASETAAARLASVERQVRTLTIRASLLHRSLIMAYVGVTTFALTMLVLLLASALGLDPAASVVFFALGLVALLAAMVTSVRELTLARDTLLEDVRSSFGRDLGV